MYYPLVCCDFVGACRVCDRCEVPCSLAGLAPTRLHDTVLVIPNWLCAGISAACSSLSRTPDSHRFPLLLFAAMTAPFNLPQHSKHTGLNRQRSTMVRTMAYVASIESTLA